MSDQPATIDADSDPCPGPPEKPYPISSGWMWAHHWTPVTIMGLPGELAASPPAGDARVLSVCQSCRQWRQETYTRWHPTPTSDG